MSVEVLRPHLGILTSFSTAVSRKIVFPDVPSTPLFPGPGGYCARRITVLLLSLSAGPKAKELR